MTDKAPEPEMEPDKEATAGSEAPASAEPVAGAATGAAAVTDAAAATDAAAGTKAAAESADTSAPKQAATAPASGKAPSSKAPSSKSPSRRPFWFLFLVLLAALGGVGWFGWQQHLSIQALRTSVASGETQSSTLRTQLAALTAANTALQESLQEQTGELAAQASERDTRLQELQQQLQTLRLQRNTATATPADVLLAEARSLLRQGRERLLASQDVPVALSLYLAADQVLQQIDDPAVQLVRQTLLRETDSLRGVRLPDLAALHSALGELRDATANWTLTSGEQARELRFVPQQESSVEPGDGWFDGLQERLSRYFVVTRQAGPVQPQLGEEGLALIRLQIDLQLEQARLALLRGDQRLYQQSLDAVAASVDTWVLDTEAEALLPSIDALRNSPLQANLPPVGATLNALQEMGVR